MIIDWFTDDPYDPPVLYERTRGADGVLHERYIMKGDEDYVEPFFWVAQAAPQYVMNRLRAHRATVHKDITATGLDNKPLMKVTVRHPNQLWEVKEKCGKWTYEADLNYLDQVLLTNYPDKLPEFKPRIWYFDLEWDTEDQSTTVMAVSDTFSDHPVVFAWSEESIRDTVRKTEWIDRYEGYELRTYPNMDEMHDGFLSYLEECNPDMLVAHAIAWADLPHLYEQLGVERDRLSPVRRVIAPSKKTGAYRTTAQPIKGRLIFDTAAQWTDGSGFEGIWQKSGKGQAQSRKLDWFATELGFSGKLTNDIEGMTVFNGWKDYYDDFVDYCLVDTTLLRDCDEKLNCISYHIAMQQLAGVSFGSTHKVTRYFRGLIGRRTDLKAPSSYLQDRPELQAAWVMPPVPGRHENVALVDFASLYPNIILSANLCWTTLVDEPGEGILTLKVPPKADKNGNFIPGTGGTFHWKQDEEGILPFVVKQMLALRKEYKRLMREADDPDTKLGYNMLQMAVKVAVNAIYGMTGSKKVGGQWSSYAIAQCITYLGRESISMLVDKSEEMGYRGLAGHTDSCYIQVPFDEAEEVAQKLTDIAQDEMGLKYLDVELEAFFPYWFTAGIKNRNFGVKSWPVEEAGSMKVTGFAMKASSATPFTKRVQKETFNLICSGADEGEVFDAVRPMVKAVYGGGALDDVTAYGRISKKLHEYDKVVPNTAKAARYSNKYNNTDFNKGDSIKWVFINGVPEGQPQCNVIAYDDASELDEYEIDWSTCVEKMVTKKLKTVYETLGWDLERLTAKRVLREW
jgi:DNA polymerase elongation subunit (family B)